MKLEWENKIAAPDAAARAAAQARWDGLAKPLGSLGLLEEAVVRIAALTGCADVRIPVRRLLVFCADNGVVAQGVTQTGRFRHGRCGTCAGGGGKHSVRHGAHCGLRGRAN